MPAERAPVLGVLGRQILRAVLPHDLDPGCGEHGHVRQVDVLRGRDDRHGGPELVLERRDSARVRPQATTRAITPWRPVTPWSRRCEKNRSGRQAVQRSIRSTLSTPAARSARSEAAQRSRLRAAHHVGPERLGHLVPDLVAARADRRADRGGDGTPGRAHRRRRATIPASRPRHPAWSTATAGRCRSIRASTIGTQSAVSWSTASPGVSVQTPSPSGSEPRRVRPPARCTIAECSCRVIEIALRLRIDLGAEAAAVLDHVARDRPRVLIPRLSEAKLPALTPPCRVEKATS